MIEFAALALDLFLSLLDTATKLDGFFLENLGSEDAALLAETAIQSTMFFDSMRIPGIIVCAF